MGWDTLVKRTNHWSLYRPCFMPVIQKKKSPRPKEWKEKKISLAKISGVPMYQLDMRTLLSSLLRLDERLTSAPRVPGPPKRERHAQKERGKLFTSSSDLVQPQSVKIFEPHPSTLSTPPSPQVCVVHSLQPCVQASAPAATRNRNPPTPAATKPATLVSAAVEAAAVRYGSAPSSAVSLTTWAAQRPKPRRLLPSATSSAALRHHISTPLSSIPQKQCCLLYLDLDLFSMDLPYSDP